MKLAFILVLILGCESLSEKRELIHSYRTNYCTSTTDSVAKQVAITAIKLKFPLYPTEGICTQLN